VKHIFFTLTINTVKYTVKQNQGYFLWLIKKIISIGLLKGLIICSLFGFVTSLSIHPIAIAEFTHSSPQLDLKLDSLLKQGHILYQSGQFTEAVNVWEKAVLYFDKQHNRRNKALTLSYLALGYQQLGKPSEADKNSHIALKLIDKYSQKLTDNFVYGQILNNQGDLLFSQGKTEAALEAWKQAEKSYKKADDKVGEIGTQINQARALQVLGYFLRANNILKKVAVSLSLQPDSQLKLSGLLHLGNNLRILGEYSRARESLQQSLEIAQKLDFPAEAQIVLLNLGKLASVEQKNEIALNLFQQAANQNNPTPNGTKSQTQIQIELQAHLYQLDILWKLNRKIEAEKILQQIQAEIPNLPPSQTKIYAEIQLATNLVKLSHNSEIYIPNPLIQAAKLFANAQYQAHIFGNYRAESTAFGKLGNLYEQTQQWKEAKTLTKQALHLAENINAPDIAYQWQWQMGRILKNQGDIIGAIANYKQAFENLQSLRQDLVAINQDIQFSFRETVEPVYRELVDLLLQDIPTISTSQQQENLIFARETIEALQITELANFFREACLDSKTVPIETIDSKAALIYPIILRDRIEIILSLPNQPLRHYSTKIPQTEVEAAIKRMRQSLRRTSFATERLTVAKQIYTWLLAPVIPNLTTNNIKTLVFILDNNLRNIPMAALSDGEKYLVEKYQIALAPSLRLFKSQPRKRNHIQILAGGITRENGEFSALPGVEREIKLLREKIPTTTLLNEKFTIDKIKAKLEKPSYSILHLATHGQFSSKASDTFIKTWNGQINIEQLSRLISDRNLKGSSPIDLLVLSACQTATGDELATLGLAGVAVRSGARSTLASLWTVSDESTADLIGVFYDKLLTVGVSKAEALRLAQLDLLKKSEFKHPYYWAAFILIGNWL
jgi:CHAT domain-containing protein